MTDFEKLPQQLRSIATVIEVDFEVDKHQAESRAALIREAADVIEALVGQAPILMKDNLLADEKKRLIELLDRNFGYVEEEPAEVVAGRIEESGFLRSALSLPRWISVKERLPEQSGTYLAWMVWDVTDAEDEPSVYPVEFDADAEAFGFWKGSYDGETLGWAGSEFVPYDGITHWMPLPAPPKEGT